MIHKNRGNRRDVTELKAERKIRICHNLNDYWRYPAKGYFRKGKIHCSCPMCSAKTNDKHNKSMGPVDEIYHRGSRLRGTHMRYGRKNYKLSDKRKVDRMTYQLNEM